MIYRCSLSLTPLRLYCSSNLSHLETTVVRFGDLLMSGWVMLGPSHAPWKRRTAKRIPISILAWEHCQDDMRWPQHGIKRVKNSKRWFQEGFNTTASFCKGSYKQTVNHFGEAVLSKSSSSNANVTPGSSYHSLQVHAISIFPYKYVYNFFREW